MRARSVDPAGLRRNREGAYSANLLRNPAGATTHTPSSLRKKSAQGFQQTLRLPLLIRLLTRRYTECRNPLSRQSVRSAQPGLRHPALTSSIVRCNNPPPYHIFQSLGHKQRGRHYAISGRPVLRRRPGIPNEFSRVDGCPGGFRICPLPAIRGCRCRQAGCTAVALRPAAHGAVAVNAHSRGRRRGGSSGRA